MKFAPQIGARLRIGGVWPKSSREHTPIEPPVGVQRQIGQQLTGSGAGAVKQRFTIFGDIEAPEQANADHADG
ncbi:MAG: hypothetical protein R3E48_21930 [Burkholderiaceae bacterium]